MYDSDKVLEVASKELRNAIYLYGGLGYFTGIEENNCFEVEIYDLSSREINKMDDKEAAKHLLKRVSVDFSDCLQDPDLIGYKIACKVMDQLRMD